MRGAPEPAPSRADVIVVGAGSAGCIVAARLSEDLSRRVLLLEAGDIYRASDIPPHLLDYSLGPMVRPETDWDLSGTLVDGRLAQLPRGRVGGGCSTINAAFALRGSPRDYDAWAAAGNTGWSFADLLPDFVGLERDLDFGAADYHGNDGPIPIQRYRGSDRSPLAAIGAEALVAAGLKPIDDHNAPGAVGVGPLPLNVFEGRRINASMAFLDPVRDRSNLTVRGTTEVARIDFRYATTATAITTGVTLTTGEIILADEVIVCAGAYHSPVLLLRSGLGDPATLRPAGIGVVAELPGVGRNLADHASVSVDLDYVAPLAGDPVFQLVGTIHSSARDENSDPPDLQIMVGGPYPGDNEARCFVAAALLQPESRGSVSIRPDDPDGPPLIDLGYFSEVSDLARLSEGFDRAWAAATHPSFREVARDPVPIADADSDDFIRGHAWTYHHPVGTCAMGPAGSTGAVVDHLGRVHGVEGLSIIDASIMPTIPSANTNIPTMAVAEHMSRLRQAGG